MDALQGEAGGQAFEQSLKEMNMTPEEVMKKIMSDPELAVVSLQTCVIILMLLMPSASTFAVSSSNSIVCMHEDKRIRSMTHFWSDLKHLSMLHQGHTYMLEV